MGNRYRHERIEQRRTFFYFLLTLVIRLPRLDDRARNGLATRVEHATLYVHVVTLPFRRDRLSERDCRRREDVR